MNDIDSDPADNDLAYNDPEYTHSEEEQNPKLREIQSVRGNKKKKKKNQRISKSWKNIFNYCINTITQQKFFILLKKLIVIQ